MNKIILIASLLFCAVITQCNKTHSDAQTVKNNKNSLGPNDFPELIHADIPGAPKLGKPQLIMGDSLPVMGEGNGWAAPGVYDWNKDGKKDLLIGEFGSGNENGHVVGSFIRVYSNVGTDAAPRFTDEFSYAKGNQWLPSTATYVGTNNGTPLSIYLWCCQAFRPQFVDLNGDGYEDLVAGHYFPGDVTWFPGSEGGFLDGQKLEQEGRDEHPVSNVSLAPIKDPRSYPYWIYSSVSFGDFTDDGLPDMIVGGGGLRLSRNTGSRIEPKFGLRELLLDTNGEPLRIYEYTQEDVKKFLDYSPDRYPAGSTRTVPLVVDWDQDGVLDLMVTEPHVEKGKNAITFFRGVKTGQGYRFEPGIPLFSSKDGGKSFPGSWIRVFVTDWNNDGVNDLLIGANVATLNGEFDYDLSWAWEHDTGIGKLNPAYYSASFIEQIEKDQARHDSIVAAMGKEEALEKRFVSNKDPYERYYGKKEYRTLAHKGYVYVMLGEK